MIVWAHQQMGDHILCNGLYRALATRHQKIRVVCIRQNIANVRVMLSDDPRIVVVEVPDEPSIASRINGGRVLKIGSHGGPFDRWTFDQEFYRQAGVPFVFRWSMCVLPNVPQIAPPNGDYLFVHDRPEMGSKIEISGNVVRPTPTKSIFAHRDLIIGAKELHCVSSAFAVFADSFDLREKPFHFYPFGRECPTNKNKWTLHE